jgi:hypothetical protein
MSDRGPLGSGTLRFVPGETVKRISLNTEGRDEGGVVRLTLSNPVNAVITGEAEIHLLQNVVIIPTGSVWKYLDDGTDPGTAWRDVDFADAAWPEGEAELGYGDDDEATVINGGPSGERLPAAYFRRRFEVAEPRAFETVIIRLRRDDGGIVYLNGAEVFRSNMPAGEVTFSTWAADTTGDEDAFRTQEIDPGVLVAGTNVAAVEVHQANQTSSDLSFEFELLGVPLPPPLEGFVRGDANADYRVDISDAVQILQLLFNGIATDCEDALDSNDDGTLNIADAIAVLSFLFSEGPAIPLPYPSPGEDPTPDDLGCARN